MGNGLGQIALLLLEFGQIRVQLREDKMVGFGLVALLFPPLYHSLPPDIASARRILVILEINPAQLEEDRGIAGKISQSLAQEKFRLSHLALSPQPEGGDGVG